MEFQKTYVPTGEMTRAKKEVLLHASTMPGGNAVYPLMMKRACGALPCLCLTIVHELTEKVSSALTIRPRLLQLYEGQKTSGSARHFYRATLSCD